MELKIKLSEVENEKIALDAEYKRITNSSDFKQITEGELQKSFKLAKRLMLDGRLSNTKKLMEMFIDRVVIYNDWVDVVFRFHEDLELRQ